jgi:hypothetical protein
MKKKKWRIGSEEKERGYHPGERTSMCFGNNSSENLEIIDWLGSNFRVLLPICGRKL